jgi:ABC-2 type transport system permease protein
MRWHKINAMVYRDFKIFTRVKYKSVEFFYFPTITVLIWGLFSIYAQQFWFEAGMIILVINMFWSFAHLAQSEVNILMMEDVWSGSIKQMLVSGLTSFEYLFARLISVGIISIVVTTLLIILSSFFVVFPNYIDLVLLVIPTLVGSMALSGIVGALIMRLGREYGFLAWTSISLLIFLSAPFFPLEFFPFVLQMLAKIMPFTYIFAGARELMTTGSVQNVYILKSYLIAFIYLILSLPIYYFSFEKAREDGKLARFF